MIGEMEHRAATSSVMLFVTKPITSCREYAKFSSHMPQFFCIIETNVASFQYMETSYVLWYERSIHNNFSLNEIVPYFAANIISLVLDSR